MLLSILLLLLLVALPLSFLQQEWYYLSRQQVATLQHLQSELRNQSMPARAAELVVNNVGQ